MPRENKITKSKHKRKDKRYIGKVTKSQEVKFKERNETKNQSKCSEITRLKCRSEALE